LGVQLLHKSAKCTPAEPSTINLSGIHVECFLTKGSVVANRACWMGLLDVCKPSLVNGKRKLDFKVEVIDRAVIAAHLYVTHGVQFQDDYKPGKTSKIIKTSTKMATV
jgi:hypothetical protein